MINNLTGTKWLWNDTIDITTYFTPNFFTINFVSNSNNYTNLNIDVDDDFELEYWPSWTSNPLTVYENGTGWTVTSAYKTIEFIGGTDSSNITLINYLYENATLLYAPPLKTSFSKISYDAVNKILTIDDKYYQLSSTATGSNVTGTSFSNMSLDELGELIIDNTSIHLPIKTTQISFDNGGTYTCANGITFTMSAFGYLDDHGHTDYQGYWFANSLGANMLIWVIEEDNQPYVWETANNWLGDSESEAQNWYNRYNSYADDMYIHVVDDGYDYMSVASQLGWSEDDLPDMWQNAETKFEGIDYVFLHFKRNRTTGYWEIQEES